MKASRGKLGSFLTGRARSDAGRRPSTSKPVPACESLEGRQLLAAGAGLAAGMPAMGMGGPANVAAAATTPVGQAATSPTNLGGWRGHAMMAQGGGTGQGAMPLSLPGGQGGFSGRGAAGYPGGGPGQDGEFGSAGSTDFGPLGTAGSTVDDQSGPGGGLGDQGGTGLGQEVQDGAGPGSTAGNAQLQADLTKLHADEQAIEDKSQVTPAMQAKVRDDIKAIKGAETTTPDPAAVATLQKDIQAAQSAVGGPTAAQLAQIQADQGAVSKSQGVSAALVGQLDADQKAIVTASGVTDADRATLAADRKAVEADFAAQAAAPPATAIPVTPPATPVTPPATPVTPAAATLAADPTTPAAATPPAVPTAPLAAPTPASARTTTSYTRPMMTPSMTPTRAWQGTHRSPGNFGGHGPVGGSGLGRFFRRGR